LTSSDFKWHIAFSKTAEVVGDISSILSSCIENWLGQDITFSVIEALESLKRLVILSRFKDLTEPFIKDKFELSWPKYATVILSKNVQSLQSMGEASSCVDKKKIAQIQI